MLKPILVLIFSILAIANSFSQNFEGLIKYEISYNSGDPSKKNNQSIPKSEQIIYIKNHKSRFEQTTKMATIIVMMDTKTNQSTILMEAGDEKLKFSIGLEDLDLLKTESVEDFNIIYTNTLKTIAGYECKEAIVKMSNGSTATFYYTEKIASRRIQGLPGLKLKGMPLEYIITSDNIYMTILATSVIEQVVPDSLFVVPSGYSEMPKEMRAALKDKY